MLKACNYNLNMKFRQHDKWNINEMFVSDTTEPWWKIGCVLCILQILSAIYFNYVTDYNLTANTETKVLD